MGCVSSKHVRRELEREQAASAASYVARHHVPNHVVSLTSSTYGALKLDAQEATIASAAAAVVKECLASGESKSTQVADACKQSSPPREKGEEQPPEVINAWELMEDLEEAVPASRSNKNSPIPRALSTPLKLLGSVVGSPRVGRRLLGGGKENRGSFTGPKGVRPVKSELTPANVPLKSHNSCKAALGMRIPLVWTPKRNSFGRDNGLSSRRSLGPLFDPDLVEPYEKELTVDQTEEQIKKMISPSPRIKKMRNRSKESSESILSRFQKKCPPGGDNSVVIYMTTLRGIRKTFEDCNVVRSVVESHLIQISERDVSMDSGFKEELRGLMGKNEAKVPVVFVKGRMIGGVEEVVKLEEEGKLGILFDGISRASIRACEGCGGARFVMCMDCNGSCKILGEDMKKVVKCGECNENGLIHCPLCS